MSQPKLLIVDDERSLRLTLGANLELEGFEVTEAESAEKALEILATQSFDLVLSDVRMPGMNGVDLYREIRKLHPTLPVILMTAYALESLLRDAVREGVFTVLPKPFDAEAAARALFRAVRGPIVLVVDDTSADAESVADALRAVGVRAASESDGDKAVARIESQEVDVCVIDLVMPKRNGADLIRQIRQLRPNTSIIAVSGYDVPEMIRTIAAEGPVDFLRKPFDPPALLETIAKSRSQAPRST